jgi:hypothetical protein
VVAAGGTANVPENVDLGKGERQSGTFEVHLSHNRDSEEPKDWPTSAPAAIVVGARHTC